MMMPSFVSVYVVATTAHKPAQPPSRHCLAQRDTATRCNTFPIRDSDTAVSPEAYVTTGVDKTQAAKLEIMIVPLTFRAQAGMLAPLLLSR